MSTKIRQNPTPVDKPPTGEQCPEHGWYEPDSEAGWLRSQARQEGVPTADARRLLERAEHIRNRCPKCNGAHPTPREWATDYRDRKATQPANGPICKVCGAINPWERESESKVYGYWMEQHPSAELSDLPELNERIVAALSYVAAGWKVFPVWWPANGGCACPMGMFCGSPAKHPMTRNGLNDATLDLEKIIYWWNKAPQANIGLPAGDNGLAVLDVDNNESFDKLRAGLASKGRRLPETLTQITGSGKRHYVFATPIGGIKNAANSFPGLPGIDTRGKGGYILAAPSEHVTGGTYEWVNFAADIAPWPSSLTKLMQPIKTPTPTFTGPSAPIGDSYVTKAIAGERDRILNAPRPAPGVSGGRNDALNMASFNLGTLVGAGALNEEAARRELHDAATTAGLSDFEATKTIASGLTAGIAQPRTRAVA